MCINPLLSVFEIQEMATGIYKGLLYKEDEVEKVNRRQFVNKHMTL